tara:strand:+ start:561 stop:704 length:144 start_codon:yes stop_codon:yes gene_type:complete
MHLITLFNEESEITAHDIIPYVSPTDEQIEELDIGGIFKVIFIIKMP